MSKQSKSIPKQLTIIKYSLGGLVLALILIVILFFRAEALRSPSSETLPSEQKNQQNKAWICPGNAWIQCDSIQEATGTSCEKEYIIWARESCEGFQGVVQATD